MILRFMSVLIFLLNPVGGLIWIFSILYGRMGIKNDFYKIFYFLLSVFLGFINLTKIPESDLASHASRFLAASNFSYLEYLIFFGKEVSFYSINYLIYYLFNGSVNVWILIITILSYYLYFYSIHKFFRFFKVNNRILLFAIILAAFFPQLFSLSAHLIRQFLAATVMIYFLIEKIFYKKNCWYLIPLGVFVHSSSLFFFIFAYLNFLKEKPNKSNIRFFIILIGSLVFYQISAKLILPFTSGLGPVYYIFERASLDTTFELGSFLFWDYLFLILLSLIFIYSSTKIKLAGYSEELNHFVNIFLILVFFILINLEQSELSNRFFFYVWFFVPFIIPLFLLEKTKIVLRNLVMTALLPFFFFQLSYGTWHYDSFVALLTNSSLHYFQKSEPDIFYVAPELRSR